MKKLLAIVLMGVMMFSLGSCKEDKKSSKKKQEKLKATQSESEITSWDNYFGTISGNGTYSDFDEYSNIKNIVENNKIDKEFLKEIKNDIKKNQWSRYHQGKIFDKYIKIWEKEWEASDKRILKLLEEETISKEYGVDIDYEAIKKEYTNNRLATKQYIDQKSKLYSTMWTEFSSRDNLYENSIMLLNLLRSAVFDSFQIENSLGGSCELVFEGE